MLWLALVIHSEFRNWFDSPGPDLIWFMIHLDCFFWGGSAKEWFHAVPLLLLDDILRGSKAANRNRRVNDGSLVSLQMRRRSASNTITVWAEPSEQQRLASPSRTLAWRYSRFTFRPSLMSFYLCCCGRWRWALLLHSPLLHTRGYFLLRAGSK